MPVMRQRPAEQIRRAIPGYRFFPANTEFLRNCNFPAVQDAAARIINTSHAMMANTLDKQEKNDYQNVIKKVSGIVQSLTEITEQEKKRQNRGQTQPISIEHLESQFKELQTLILSLPGKAEPDPESKLTATSSKIAGVCFYLLVLSASITIGATFGAWYFGFLSASYFVDMVVSSLAYFDIPIMLLGLVAYGVSPSQPTPSTEENLIDVDATRFFNSCKNVIDSFIQHEENQQARYRRD